MSATLNPSSRAFFERMYAASADPWKFASDPYELSRYNALIQALEGQHFERAFEPGCSIGILTERLAPLCDSLLATDLSSSAAAQARERCASLPHVHIEQGSVSDVDPGPLDLLVLSELGYYFAADALRAWAGRLLSQLRPGGTLLAAHWLGVSSDHILSGDRVHGILCELALHHNYALTLARRTENFRLDKWTRA